MSILNSLNKVLVLSTVVLCLSVNAAPFSPPVNAPPFSPPDHKHYVVEAAHITHTTKSLLELGSSAYKLGKSIFTVENVAKSIASNIKPTTPKLGIGGTVLKSGGPIILAMTAFGVTNDILDLGTQAGNKRRMKEDVDQAISKLSYVLKTGGRPVDHNGKTYEIDEILNTYTKAASEFNVPDPGLARNTALVIRNALIPFMDPAADTDNVAAVSLWVLKQEIDALRVKLEPLVRDDLKNRYRDSAIKSLEKMDANCVVNYVCTRGDKDKGFFFESETNPNSSDPRTKYPRIRTVVIPFAITKIPNLPDFLKNLTSSISKNGPYKCLGERFDLKEVDVFSLDYNSAYYVSYKEVFEAIKTECKDSGSYIEGKKDARWTPIPDAKVSSGRGWPQAYITQSQYMFGGVVYHPKSASFNTQLLMNELRDKPSFDPLYPHKKSDFPEQPKISRGRHD